MGGPGKRSLVSNYNVLSKDDDKGSKWLDFQKLLICTGHRLYSTVKETVAMALIAPKGDDEEHQKTRSSKTYLKL